MTSSFIVQSEHDMDRVISDAIQMSKDIQDIKKMRISFPTDQLAEIFLENLAGKFIEALHKKFSATKKKTLDVASSKVFRF